MVSMSGHELPQHAAQLDRLAPPRRPVGPASGFQRWTDLTFLHWRSEAATVRRLLPPGLELDTWDGDAWIGLIPFHMSGVRPRWGPPVPGISAFHETNLRTYVHYAGKPGIWFFSLEAASRLAVWAARRWWHLPYFFADLGLHRSGDQLRYTGRRAGQPQAEYDVSVRLLPATAESGTRADYESAAAGTLEHFLVERYHLYARSPDGWLWRGQVHHRPYPLGPVELLQARQTLTDAAGLGALGAPCHTLYSPGVAVEIFPLEVCGPS